MPSTPDSDIVYSDRWLTLRSSGTLAIHKYCFPTTSSRTLQVPRIKSITTGKAFNLKWWDLKVWGAGPSWIYWPLDWERGKALWGCLDEVIQRSLVIKTNEGFFHTIGVTCENIEIFLQEAEKAGIKVLKEQFELHSHSE